MNMSDTPDGVVICEVAGDQDAEEQIEAIIARLQVEPANAVIDLTGATLLNSTSIGMLVALHNQLLVSSHRLVLCGMEHSIREMFAILRLETVLDTTDDLDAALMALEAF